MLRIAFASDHAGYSLKESLKKQLDQNLYSIVDFGAKNGTESCSYVAAAKEACEALTRGEVDRIILVCGTGIGMAIAANRYPAVRAANCTNEYMARMSREHNDANVLTLGERVIGERLAWGIMEAFLTTSFESGRHKVRLDEIQNLMC